MWKYVLVFLAVLFISRIIAYRKSVIKEKLKNVKNFKPEEGNKLQYLAMRCLEKAEAAGVTVPNKHGVVVCDLNDDPYTWFIMKLGIHDTELFRCRMTIEEMSDAMKYSREKEEEKEEESGN